MELASCRGMNLPMRAGYRVGWWVLLALAACGGRVEEDDPEDPLDPEVQRPGDPGGSGAGKGSGSGGPSCAATPPHPDYPLCYETQYPPCLAASSSKLTTKLSVAPGSLSRGPWVGTNGQCRMLCCYAP